MIILEEFFYLSNKYFRKNAAMTISEWTVFLTSSDFTMFSFSISFNANFTAKYGSKQKYEIKTYHRQWKFHKPKQWIQRGLVNFILKQSQYRSRITMITITR